MAGREIGPIRQRVGGDTLQAKAYTNIARTQLGILKNLMSFNDLKQLSRTIYLGDGTRIHVSSVFGQDSIRVYVPEGVGVEGGAVEKEQGYLDKVVDYVGVAMPNPVPYRGVSIGVAAAADSTAKTYVMASDGQVLASEVQTTAPNATNPANTDILYAYFPSFGGVWSGGTKLWMARYNGYNSNYCYNHKIEFEVPEDCIYPMPPTAGNTFDPTGYCTGNPSQVAWAVDWDAGVTAFKARRKAWFKKNTTELMAALKGNFKLGATGVTRAELQTGKIPASWDYAIKTHCYTSYKTYQPILMTATYVDVVVSDTSAGLTQAGTRVTKRTVTFKYTDAEGVFPQKVVEGTQTQVVTIATGDPNQAFPATTWFSWYEPAGMPGYGGIRIYPEFEIQFSEDKTGSLKFLLWTGVEQAAPFDAVKDSHWSYNGHMPGNPLVNPGIPFYSNTLVGTAPDFIKTYHNTVLPKYISTTPSATHDGNTAWNNSSMYNVKQVHLCLFGPAPNGEALGIFVDPTDADGATKIAYYGEAVCSFDWSTGETKVTDWAPKKDANGNEAPVIVDMPANHSYKNQSGVLYLCKGTTNYTQAYNCAIGYVWDKPTDLWKDVDEYLTAKIKAMKAGNGDQVLYTVIKQALAIPPNPL